MLNSSGFSSISIIYLRNRLIRGKGGRRAWRIGVRAEAPAPTGGGSDEEECVHTLFYAVFARPFAGIGVLVKKVLNPARVCPYYTQSFTPGMSPPHQAAQSTVHREWRGAPWLLPQMCAAPGAVALAG